MIDGISYFTNGLCISQKPLDAVSYFTNGLLLPSGATVIKPGGGIAYGSRSVRDSFVRRAKEESEFIQLLVAAISVIDRDSEI